MKRTLEEWFKYFEHKSKRKHHNPAGFQTIFDEEKGYCQLCVDGDTLLVKEVCGDGLFWYKFVFDFVKEHKLKKVTTFLSRSIKTYIRLMHWHITETTQCIAEHNGLKICGEGEGGIFKIFPYRWNPITKRYIYFGIWEVSK